MIIKKVPVEHLDALALLGRNDANLRQIEREVPVRITLRDGTITVSGDEDAVGTARARAQGAGRAGGARQGGRRSRRGHRARRARTVMPRGSPRRTKARPGSPSTARPCGLARRARPSTSRRSKSTRSCSRSAPPAPARPIWPWRPRPTRCVRNAWIASSWYARPSRRVRVSDSCPATCRRRWIRTCARCTTRSPISCLTTGCDATSSWE